MVSAFSGSTATFEEGTAWESYCEDIWRGVEFSDESSVLSKSWEFVSVALESFCPMDFHRMAINSKAYNWVSPEIQHGGPANLFDWGAMTQSLVVAECCCNLRLFDQAYLLVEDCLGLLCFEGNERPNRHLWLATLRIIAECKWQQSKLTRDKLWSPEWICEEYDRKYQQVMEVLKKRPEVNKDGSFTESLETTGLSVLKMAVRYLPERFPGMVDNFNSLWGTTLAKADGHFLESDHCGEKARCYWDFEIAKRMIGGKLTLEELDYCHKRLIQASLEELEGNQKNYLLSLDLQYRYLAKTFTNILEFPGGKCG